LLFVPRSGMYQPEPTAFIQVPTGYGMGHVLPDYTFEETPLGLSGGGGGYGGGPGTVGAGGGAGTLIYTTPIFSASGPASVPFQFHSSDASTSTPSTTTTTSPASSVLGHQQRLSPHSHSSSAVKMEPNHDDMHAQEAAARDYQPDLKVHATMHPDSVHSYSTSPRSLVANTFLPSI